MQRIIYITTIFATLLFSGCAIEDEDTKRSDSLGKSIWYAVEEDLNRVNDIFIFAERAYTYMVLSEEEQQGYRERYFTQYEISQNGNTYHFKMAATSTTYITTAVTLYEDRMELSRSGGSSYDLVIRPSDNNTYTAEFSTLNHQESEGKASFVVMLTNNDTQHTFAYKGNMTMVDHEESVTSPLTIETRISDWLTYNVEYGNYESGRIFIDCYDKRYNSHDEVRVLINDKHIYITIFGMTESI